MNVQTWTPSDMRVANEHAVYTALYADVPSSAPKLGAATGLSKPTIALALANLERGGLIERVGLHSTGRAGRSPMLYRPNPRAGWVLAADVGRNLVRVALADLSGGVVDRLRVKARSEGAEHLAEQLERGAAELLAGHELTPADVLSVVVGGPGVYDPDAAEVRLAPQLPGWGRPELARRLRDRLGEHTVFANDADLAAVAERAHGLGSSVGSFVYLTIGTGIGMGIMLGDRLHRGAHGAAGEIGFLYPPGQHEFDGSARARGRLESLVAADGILAAARRLDLPLGEPAEVFALAATDARAAEVVAGEVDHLAHALVPVVTLLDPELVVLGGGVGVRMGPVLERLRTRLGELVPLPVPRVAVSGVGDDTVLLGAVAYGVPLAREAAFSRAAR